MKLFGITMCIFVVVTADVSHLTGHGYNYDKPSVVFNVPQHTSVIQSEYAAPASIPVQHQELSQVLQSSSNGYLPPQQKYSPALEEHQEISQPISISHQEIPQQIDISDQEISHQEVSQPIEIHRQPITSAPFVGPVYHQEISQPQYSVPASTPVQYHDISQHINIPSNEYLSPQIQQSLAPVQHQEIFQPNTLAQPQNFAPASPPIHHHEITQSFVAPSSDYLPPQSQYIDTPVTPIHQQEISQHIVAPQSEYSAPNLTPVQNQQITQPIAAPASDYLPPQQDYTAPVQTPAIPQEHSLTTSPSSSDYLPPQQEYSVPATAHHQQHIQEHQHHHESQSVSDGYHYNAPAKSFRF